MMLIRDHLQSALFVAGGFAVFAAAIFDIWFMRTGSKTPDPATDRIFAVQEHGTLYVSPWLAHLEAILFFAGLAAIALGAILVFWRKLKLRAR